MCLAISHVTITIDVIICICIYIQRNKYNVHSIKRLVSEFKSARVVIEATNLALDILPKCKDN